MDELLRELIEYLQTVSPMIWETLIRQVYTEAIINGVWAVVCVVSIIVMLKLAKHFTNKLEDASWSESTDYNIGRMFLYIFAAICTPVSVLFMTEAVVRLLNPQYYAIQLILNNLR